MMHKRQNTKFKSKRKESSAYKMQAGGPTWWSRCQDSMLPMKGVEVRSLVRKLRSHMPSSVTKQQICIYIYIYIVRNVLENFILNVDRLQFWLGKFQQPLLKRTTGWLSLFSTDHTNRNPLFQQRTTALSLRSAEEGIF